MPNPLTGDFEAVLQVSGSTINRLLASMHQNAFSRPHLPSFPHSVRLRLGDDHALDGVRGRVHAQIGVPRIDLVHGATDRFQLEVAVRAWFRPDPGTEPLPAYIHGVVRAEYRLHDIDPGCRGWARLAPEYVWMRVVRDTVRFQGTAEDDVDEMSVIATGGGAPAPAADLGKIARQIAFLLAYRFEATPHPVSARFRRGRLRSLSTPSGESAVVLPLPVNGEPAGQVASVEHVLLGGADLAIGLDVAVIMRLVRGTLDEIRTFSLTVPVSAAGISTVYRVGLHPPAVEWRAHGTYAAIKIIESGWAKTDSILADATFDIDQDVNLNFDGGSGRLWLAPGSLHVRAHASGLGSGTVAHRVSAEVTSAVRTWVRNACTTAQPSLDGLTTRTIDLSNQLRTLDEQANVRVDRAQFLADGLVLRGTIALSARQAPVVKAEKTPEGNGHSALDSWIPGGRVDSCEWSWSWAGSGKGGRATFTDRFLLRRPAGRLGRWGLRTGIHMPLPGLDGWGQVCLRVKGVRVDHVTGKLVPVESVRRCSRFGYHLSIQVEGRGLLLRDLPELSKDVPFPQLAIVRADGGPRMPGAGNTLLLFVDERWDPETAATLQDGLAACGRFDAGLALLVLFREGVLAAGAREVMREVERVPLDLGVPVLVNEDVHGTWSRRFQVRIGTGEPSWRLIGPRGAVAWSHDGRLGGQALGSALDASLVASPDVSLVETRPALDVGTAVSAAALHPGWFENADAPCPPVPLGRLGYAGSVVAFVKSGSAAAHRHLRALAARYRQRDEGPLVVVVVDGADAREAYALKHGLGLDVLAVPDPDGRITDRFRIDTWPTTMTLDAVGTIAAIEVGASSEDVESTGSASA